MIQSLWIGERLSTLERLAISSFLENGHSYHLYVYAEVKGVPRGTVLKNAAEIVPPGMIFKCRHHDTYAGFSDLFRYKLLLERGGYWVDADVVCLRPFHFQSDHLFAGILEPRRPLAYLRRRPRATGWFIKAPAGSELMEFCYREAAGRDPGNQHWGEMGPRLVNDAVARFGMQEQVAPWGTFFPVRARQWRQLINGSPVADWKWRTAGQRSYGVHLYNEMWRRNTVDKDGSFPPNSIYERLKRRFLRIDQPTGAVSGARSRR